MWNKITKVHSLKWSPAAMMLLSVLLCSCGNRRPFSKHVLPNEVHHEFKTRGFVEVDKLPSGCMTPPIEGQVIYQLNANGMQTVFQISSNSVSFECSDGWGMDSQVATARTNANILRDRIKKLLTQPPH